MSSIRKVTRRSAVLLATAATVTPRADARASDAGKALARRLHTRLCSLLGIESPVIQAPMPGITTPEMVAAVAEGGGLGILPGVGLPPETLRAQIRRIRMLTQRPFGVNLLLHPELRAPTEPARIPAEVVRGTLAMLNEFRARLRIPSRTEVPAFEDVTAAAFEVIHDEHVPVFSAGLGVPPREWITRCQARGTRVIAMGCTVADCRELASLGIDAVVAQGSEAGGHRSTWAPARSAERACIGALSLVPQVVDSIDVPVIAAGGICDGRQLAATLALGAEGVLMGTRFIATQESAAPPFYKSALLAADSDDTILTEVYSGLQARVLRNFYVEAYRASGAPVLPAFVQYVATADLREAAVSRANADYFPLFSGQGVGLLRDMPRCADLVRSIVAESQKSVRLAMLRNKPAPEQSESTHPGIPDRGGNRNHRTSDGQHSRRSRHGT